MKRAAVVGIFCMFFSCENAQIIDTIRELFKYGYSLDARLESRYSLVDHQLISVEGIRLGVSFKRKFRLGGGVSWLDSDVHSNYTARNDAGDLELRERFLKFVYLSYYIDFVFYKTKRWQLSVPIQAGTGLSWFQDNNRYFHGKNASKYFLLLYEPGITAQFKVLKWAGLGADVAYRFTLKNNKKVGEQLNSPTYAFKILIWFDQLFYEFFPGSPITKKYGPAYW
jgi:hypothetical protein